MRYMRLPRSLGQDFSVAAPLDVEVQKIGLA